MHFNSDGTTGFFGKMSIHNNYSKSVVVLYYQLPLLQSGRFPDKMGLGRSYILQVYPAFSKFEIHLKI